MAIFEQQIHVQTGDPHRVAEAIGDQISDAQMRVRTSVDGSTVTIAVEPGNVDASFAGDRIHGWIGNASEATGATITWGSGSYRAGG